jgi:hypothetical protein
MDSTLETLPNELVSGIVSRMLADSPHRFPAAMNTCKRLRQLWQHIIISLTIRWTGITYTQLSSIAKHYNALQRLRLVNLKPIWSTPDCVVPSQAIAELGRSLKHLTLLEYRRYPVIANESPQIPRIMEACIATDLFSRLTELILIEPTVIFGKFEFSMLMAMRALTNLRIGVKTFSSDILYDDALMHAFQGNGIGNLQHLMIDVLRDSPVELLPIFPGSLTGLTSLRVRSAENKTNIFDATSAFSKLVNLRELDTSNCVVCDMLYNLTQLTQLRIHGSQRNIETPLVLPITLTALVSLDAHMCAVDGASLLKLPSLVNINYIKSLHWTTDATDASSLCAGGRMIEELVMWNRTDDGLEMSLEFMPHLTHLTRLVLHDDGLPSDDVVQEDTLVYRPQVVRMLETHANTLKSIVLCMEEALQLPLSLPLSVCTELTIVVDSYIMEVLSACSLPKLEVLTLCFFSDNIQIRDMAFLAEWGRGNGGTLGCVHLKLLDIGMSLSMLKREVEQLLNGSNIEVVIEKRTRHLSWMR